MKKSNKMSKKEVKGVTLANYTTMLIISLIIAFIVLIILKFLNVGTYIFFIAIGVIAIILGIEVYNFIGFENELIAIKKMLKYDKFYKLKVKSLDGDERFKYISTIIYGNNLASIFAKLNIDNTITLFFKNEMSNNGITTTIYPINYSYFLTHFEVEKMIDY